MSPKVVDPAELLDEEEEEYEDESGFNFMVIDGDKKSLDLKNKVRYITNLMDFQKQYFKIILLEGRVVP